MADYEIREIRDSRPYEEEWARFEEVRHYVISITKTASARVVISPTMARTGRLGTFPNPRGRGRAVAIKIGAEHPDAYSGDYSIYGSMINDRLVMRLYRIRSDWMPNTTRSIWVKLYYHNYPDPEKPAWSGDMGLISEQTRTDINLKQIRGPNGEMISVSRLTPQNIRRATIRAMKIEEGFWEAIDHCGGKLNSEYFLGHGPKRWMFIGAQVDPVDDDRSSVSYSFQLNRHKWITSLRPLGEDGEPDLSIPPMEVELYETVNFNALHGLGET